MPDFTRAEVSNETTDLTAYRAFLKRLEVGQTVTLPLEGGETTRRVMRALNLAAGYNSMRITRLPGGAGSVVRFRVLSGEKRQISISDEAKRARVEKARETRARRRTEPSPAVDAAASDVAPADETTGMASAGEPDTTQVEVLEPPAEERAQVEAIGMPVEVAGSPAESVIASEPTTERGATESAPSRPVRRRRGAS